MTMPQERGGDVLMPNQEFAEAKDAADEVFAEVAFEIARAIATPSAISEIAQFKAADITIPKQYAQSPQALMIGALTGHINKSFDALGMENSAHWLSSQPEFLKVVRLLHGCPHETAALREQRERYQKPFDNLRTNFTFFIARFMGAYELTGKHAFEPHALQTAQKPHRQIASLYNYQEQFAYSQDKLTNIIRPGWSEETERLHIVYPGGMSAVRRLIDAALEEGASTRPSNKDPRPPYDYKRGCAALRKPEGEADDAFNIMWEWCVQAVTDPRLQHLLGAKK